MGFLKNLLDIAGKVAAVAQELSEQQKSAPKPAASAAPAYSSEPAPWRSEGEWRSYFREIIMAECPAFEIREEVPVTELVGDAADEFKLYESRPRQVYKAEWGQPYTFVLYQGGAPKGVVMLGAGHSHSAGVKYLIARMYAKKIGLPYINFYTQMPNERAYVASRLHRFLD
jgi:hypothetical protein